MILRLIMSLKRSTIEVNADAKRVLTKVLFISTVLLILGYITAAPLCAQTPPDEPEEQPFWKASVTYTSPELVSGPLSFGLSVLPDAVNAMFQFHTPTSLPASGGELTVSSMTSASLIFGDADLTLADLFHTEDDVSTLPNFKIGVDALGEINLLEYAFGPFNTLSEVGGVVLNSVFELNITGMDLATNEEFHYRYETSSQSLAAVPEPATMTLLGIGLVGLVGASARRKWKKKAVDKS